MSEDQNSNRKMEELKERVRETLGMLGKKIGLGMKKTGTFMQKTGQNVKLKIDERRNIVNQTSRGENDIPEAFCVGCGSLLAPELRLRLFDGGDVICENCGKLLKINSETGGV